MDLQINTQELDQSSMLLVQEAESILIDSEMTYLAASSFLLNECKALQQEIHATFDDPCSAAHVAHKTIVAARTSHLAPLQAAERVVKKKIGEWHTKQEAIRQQELAAARQAAREEAQRIAEEEAINRAVELECQGRTEEAVAAIESPLPVQPKPVVSTPQPQLAGVSVRKVWKFRIINQAQIAPEFMVPDTTKIGQLVRTLGASAGSTIGAGIEIYQDEVVTAKL